MIQLTIQAMNKTRLIAYEISSIDDLDTSYRVNLKSLDNCNPNIKAIIGETLPLLVDEMSHTAITVIGKVPSEQANEYNSKISICCLPSKEIMCEGDILSDFPGEPFAMLKSIQEKTVSTIFPLNQGDILIIAKEV